MYLALAFTSWSIWCALMTFWGPPFDQPVLRAIVRFSAFVIPAYGWLKLSASGDHDRFRIRTNAKQGITVGVWVSVAWAILNATQTFNLPSGTHAWLNVILLSPIAEEILFRRVVIDYAISKTSAMKAIIASSIAFAVIHLPWWLLSGEKTLPQIASLLVIMFVYGIVFGLLYYRTKSLWASLIPHAVNNLIATSIVT